MKETLKFLQIDASSEDFLYINLYQDGIENHILLEEKRCHLKKMIPSIQNILNSNNCKLVDMDFIALNEGPGSWTGLRIAFSTVKILAQVNNLKVITYNNFDNLIKNSKNETGVFLSKASNENFYYFVMHNSDPYGHGVISKKDLEDFYPNIKRYFHNEKDFNFKNILIDRYYKNDFTDSKNMEPFYLAEGVIFNKSDL